MNQSLSPKEYETLSAYVDGQLSPRERRDVEARIRNRPEWRVGYDEIQSTRRYLRSLPKRRAPRNFTITPAMAGRTARPAPRVYPFLRLVSAVAGILLVVVFASDLAMNLTAKAIMQTSRDAYPPAAAAQTTGGSEQPTIAAAVPNVPSADQRAMPAPTDTAEAFAPKIAAGTGENAAPTPEPTSPFPQQAFSSTLATPESTPTEPPIARGLGGGCEGTCAPEATPADGMSIESVPGESPTIDETQQAEAAMTAAPPGRGEGPLPEATQPPANTAPLPDTPPAVAAAPLILPTEPPASPTESPVLPAEPPVSPTATPEEPTENTLLLAPTATSTEAWQPSIAGSAPATSPQPTTTTGYSSDQKYPPTNRTPVLRLIEALLAGIAVATGIGAIFLRARASR